LIFFSSRIAPEKDAETLLRAVDILVKAGHEIWVLHRSGGHRQFIARAAQFGLADRVIATDAADPRGGLATDYQAATLCVQASRQEGLGFSPLEALSCEVPAIGASVGGIRETIVDGRTGWTYPVGDAQSLARVIQLVLDFPDEAARRAREGRRMVCAEYERKIVFDRLARACRNWVSS
jgi:glycosyltransferase involved in cell wall biosynthesis